MKGVTVHDCKIRSQWKASSKFYMNIIACYVDIFLWHDKVFNKNDKCNLGDPIISSRISTARASTASPLGQQLVQACVYVGETGADNSLIEIWIFMIQGRTFTIHADTNNPNPSVSKCGVGYGIGKIKRYGLSINSMQIIRCLK